MIEGTKTRPLGSMEPEAPTSMTDRDVRYIVTCERSPAADVFVASLDVPSRQPGLTRNPSNSSTENSPQARYNFVHLPDLGSSLRSGVEWLVRQHRSGGGVYCDNRSEGAVVFRHGAHCDLHTRAYAVRDVFETRDT